MSSGAKGKVASQANLIGFIGDSPICSSLGVDRYFTGTRYEWGQTLEGSDSGKSPELIASLWQVK
jgi:hypothetical protein